MLKDRIIEIVKTLDHLTETGILNWVEDNPNPNTRSYRRKMISSGEDSTVYEIEIKFSLNGEVWKLDDEGLWLRNTSLPNGVFYITDYRSDNEVSKLRDTILKRSCSDMNPSIEDVEDLLSKIAKGISISEFREGKLKKILN
jgi:hypothetical protein